MTLSLPLASSEQCSPPIGMHADGVQRRRTAPSISCITTVCFRVTRACNLRCCYCQAPPTGTQQTFEDLVAGLRWLRGRGTERVKFTGGEPFVYPRLIELVEVCRHLGMEPTVVTNGTLISDASIAQLCRMRARVKVSLHGPASYHDALQGAVVFDSVLDAMRRLIAAGVDTSVHTLISRQSSLLIYDWIRFLIRERVRKVSFMPFVPRGRGQVLADRWSLTPYQREALCAALRNAQRVFANAIVVRYVDFLHKPYIVFETDGRLVRESAAEVNDVVLPDGPFAGSVPHHTGGC